jgi:hypothetical protein
LRRHGPANRPPWGITSAATAPAAAAVSHSRRKDTQDCDGRRGRRIEEYYRPAYEFVQRLGDLGYPEWQQRLHDAIRYGATGGEIHDDVLKVLRDFRWAHLFRRVPKELRERIKYIEARFKSSLSGRGGW